MKRLIPFVFAVGIFFAVKPALAFEPVYAPLGGNSIPVVVSNQPVPAVPTASVPVNQPVDFVAAAPVAPEDVPPPVPEKMDIIAAVAKGREILAPVLADFKSKEPHVKPVASKNGLTAAAIALWSRADDTVTVVGGTRGAHYFTPDNGSPAIPIVTHAGSQTAFRDNDPNLVVVGTVQGDMIAVTYKKKKMYAPRFSYYVPYNLELYGPETLAAGSDYLSGLIQEAFSDLEAKGIESRAFPGQKLTAVIDPYLIKSIAVIEHADGQIYEDDNSEDALGRFLVKLAVNREDALDTALSVAGARGMVQFIPSTYKLMVNKRPDLALIPDFVKGMADHRNAIEAEAAYLDMILADMPQAVRDLYIENRGAAAEYMAAGYNGGSSRVKKAIAAWGEAWSKSHSKNSLYKETVGYVVKLRRVYDMLAAGFFATPNAPDNTVLASAPAAGAADPVSSGGLIALNTSSADNY